MTVMIPKDKLQHQALIISREGKISQHRLM